MIASKVGHLYYTIYITRNTACVYLTTCSVLPHMTQLLMCCVVLFDATMRSARLQAVKPETPYLLLPFKDVHSVIHHCCWSLLVCSDIVTVLLIWLQETSRLRKANNSIS